jgi:hypothetical protein
MYICRSAISTTVDLRRIGSTVDVPVDVSTVEDTAGDEETETRSIAYAVVKVYGNDETSFDYICLNSEDWGSAIIGIFRKC